MVLQQQLRRNGRCARRSDRSGGWDFDDLWLERRSNRHRCNSCSCGAYKLWRSYSSWWWYNRRRHDWRWHDRWRDDWWRHDWWRHDWWWYDWWRYDWWWYDWWWYNRRRYDWWRYDRWWHNRRRYDWWWYNGWRHNGRWYDRRRHDRWWHNWRRLHDRYGRVGFDHAKLDIGVRWPVAVPHGQCIELGRNDSLRSGDHLVVEQLVGAQHFRTRHRHRPC